MAIFIQATPKDFAPVYNKMEYLLKSDNVGEPSFTYLVDIYINGSGTRTARLRIPIRPTDGFGKVDIHRVLESALTSDIGNPLGIAATYSAPNSSLNYIVEFGEEYAVAGVITAFPNLTTDISRKAFNASLEKSNFINWDATDYEFELLGSTKKFLTNMPNDNKVSLNSHGWLYYKGDAIIGQFVIQRLNQVGTPFPVRIDATATSGDIQFVPSAPASLNL